MVVDSVYSIYSERLDALSYTRKPPCLSAVAAVMICIKWIPITMPSQPLCAGPSVSGIPAEG